jgi:hypothetical protein
MGLLEEEWCGKGTGKFPIFHCGYVDVFLVSGGIVI